MLQMSAQWALGYVTLIPWIWGISNIVDWMIEDD